MPKTSLPKGNIIKKEKTDQVFRKISEDDVDDGVGDEEFYWDTVYLKDFMTNKAFKIAIFKESLSTGDIAHN